MLFRRVQFKTYELLFVEYSFNIFGPWMTVGDRNCRKQNADMGGLTVFILSAMD